MSEEERAAVESADSAAAAEPEVRPEELTQGIDQVAGVSAFPAEVVEELRQPLDPNRVRRRKGRGSGQFEYLAGHDVKRRANEIFGFGNWGHSVVERELLGAVEVQSQNGQPGWHVGYATTVRVWVDTGTGRTYTTEGVGYGDGVEYVGAARVTACELAIKESETDALKRAFTDLGDQFGLILYAKEDEKRRIDRDRSRDETSGPYVRVETVEGPQPPRNFSEALDRLVRLGHPAEDWYQWWVPQLIEVVFEAKDAHSTRDLNQGERAVLGQKLGTVILDLEAGMEGNDFPPPTRAQIQAAFSKMAGGVELAGPPWRIDKDETDRPTQPDWEQITKRDDDLEQGGMAGEAADAEMEKLAEETVTGPPS